MNRISNHGLALFGLLSALGFAGCAPRERAASLWDLCADLRARRFVDLTHAFEPGIPHWPGFQDEERTVVYFELLTNLDQVPEAGAIAVVSFPKPKGGSGFPARVFAIVP